MGHLYNNINKYFIDSLGQIVVWTAGGEGGVETPPKPTKLTDHWLVIN